MLVLLAALLGWLYTVAPVTQLADSRYTLLASHAALHHQTLLLDAYELPQGPYQLDVVNGHTVSHYPPGTPLLTVPLLAWRESLGESVLGPSGRYAPWLEERVQHSIAAILTAVTVLLIGLLARTWLPLPWTLGVMVVVGLGSPLLSTASRALWSHTWGVLVLTLLLLHLRRLGLGRPVSPVLLGSLGALLYLIRPSFSLAVAATGLYLLDHVRRTTPRPWHLLVFQPLPLRFGLTVLAWLAPFWLWSYSIWGHPLPAYYRHPLGNPAFLQALAGNLVSPQRGLLLYCAWLVPVGVLLTRYRATLPQPRLVVMALGYALVHWVLISANPMWTGGGSYGPRLLTDLVPIFALLLIVALAAWRTARATQPTQRWMPTALGVSTLLALALHVDGAWNTETWRWHTWPHPESEFARMWNWERAEFLAGLWQPIAPYQPGTRLAFTEQGGVQPYLLRGWANPEAGATWTMAQEASIQLALPRVAQARTLTLEMAPFLGRPPQPQQVAVAVNGVHVGDLVVAKRDRYSLPVPADVAMEPDWRIDLHMARPQRPDEAGLGTDNRLLGLSVLALEIR